MAARSTILISFALLAISTAIAAGSVSGKVTEYVLTNGLTERCEQIDPLPGANYSRHDLAKEQKYCSIDFSNVALCPKLWSTSPGTIVYAIDLDQFNGDPSVFEALHCAEGHHARDAAEHKLASFKISVNARDSSATYAPSSWVYYHFSRYFSTNVYVPPAVYRSMDAGSHNARVTKPASKIVGDRHGLRMLSAGWRFLDEVETGSEGGSAASAALTDNGRQVFGVLLDNKGDRYGAEVNGTRESGWGAGQNDDFQQTAPFLALRSEQPVQIAARDSIVEARRNPKMARALAADTPVEQIVFWMQDVLEITLLDYILGQQDRIGNIDYNWYWYWIEDGELQSHSAHDKEPPDKIAAFNPVRLRQSAINDNDAGVRSGYVNFTAKTHMLEGLRHYSATVYQQLGRLAGDFENQGPAWQWLTESAGLSTREAEAIGRRTREAFELLQADCNNNTLKLDLDPAHIVFPGKAAGAASNPSCVVETH